MKLIFRYLSAFFLKVSRCIFGCSYLFIVIPRYLYFYTIGIFRICFVFFSHLFNYDFLRFMNITALLFLFNCILCAFVHFSILFITSFVCFMLVHRHAKSSANAYTPLQIYYSSVINVFK